MASDWTQLCPTSPRHRYLDNGQIEVEGEGVSYASGEGYYQDQKAIQPVWEQWSDVLQQAADEFRLPPTYLLAEMIIESRGKNYPLNSAGAGGLMGMLPASFSFLLGRSATGDEVMDPLTNVRGAAAYMAYNVGRYGLDLPALVAAHNAGSVKCSPASKCHSTIDGQWSLDGTSAPTSWGTVEDCTQGHTSGYVRRAVEIHNSAIAMGIGGSTGAGWGTAVALVGGALAGFGLVACWDEVARAARSLARF